MIVTLITKRKTKNHLLGYLSASRPLNQVVDLLKVIKDGFLQSNQKTPTTLLLGHIVKRAIITPCDKSVCLPSSGMLWNM